jgi:hypothetical protein
MSEDPRDAILLEAYERNAAMCERLGHHYITDPRLNGDYACGYCRALRALTPALEADKTITAGV